ncbi:MAG: hypothetical protein PHP22_02775 [Oscillospiraceae bacterium]|nr:hypothetical protein [Oscillospiraceae bacterium]
MTIEVFLCPQYSGNLEEVHKSGYYTCPYCRTRMRINVYEPDPNTQPDDRRTIFDRDTSAKLCYIKLPRRWLAEGSMGWVEMKKEY